MPRRPDPAAMQAANVAACPALETLLRIARCSDNGNVVREWPSPLCHATSWEVGFANDIAAKCSRWSLSEAQCNLIAKIVAGLDDRAARRVAEVEAAQPVPTGRREVDGTVLTIKSRVVTLGYGRYATTLKMLVQCDGFKLWGTVPSSIAEQVQRGDRVVFAATVTEKERGFGLFSRPTNAACLATVVAAG